MAKLVKCRTCEKEVASRAKVCPHCGEKNPTARKTSMKTILIGIGVIIILMALFGPTAEEKANQTKIELQKNKAKIEELDAKAKKIPVSDYTANYNIYEELVDLDPTNKTYIKKLEHYKAGYELQNEIAISCRIEGSKSNKASLNNSETYDESWGFSEEWKNGSYYYEQEFTGQNSFGVASRLKAQYKCSINKDKTITIQRIFLKEVK